MTDLIELAPAWAAVADNIASRRSVLVIAPRNYGKWAALEKYVNGHADDADAHRVIVSSRVPLVGSDVDYSLMWDAIRSRFRPKKKWKVNDASSFLGAFEAILHDLGGYVSLFVSGAGRGHEESHFRVLATFQRLLPTGKLAIVTTDDYSSFYYHKQNFLLSDLRLVNVHIGPTTRREIASCITSTLAPKQPAPEYVVSVADSVYEQSGGHVGLAQEILSGLRHESWPSVGRELTACIQGILKRSVVLEAISHALEEDAEGYARTALEYRSPAIPENSPRIHVLRQLGVLHREDPPAVRLCGGAIARMVDGLNQKVKVASQQRMGTVVTESGPRIFEEGPVALTDDDLVILHISDLHVGDHYKHRVTWRGGQVNPNEQSAEELLRDDLQSLQLLGRVDGMVLSGDFVWSGTAAEFRRAQNVVEALISDIGIDVKNVILVPGNHDIEWNPSPLSSKMYGSTVSRESYDDFLKLLGKTGFDETDLLEIESRSKRTLLRIVGLDSNKVEGPQAAGIGFVSREALAQGTKLLSDSTGRLSKDQRALTWLTVHHHVFPATSAGLADAQAHVVSTMANSAAVLEFANQWRVEAILHGHEHQPSLTVARRWPLDVGDVFSPIATIGAGSFGVKREYLGPFSRNHYYILIRREGGILVRSRHQGSGGVRFVAHSDMWLPR
jgi:hypothetical protein